MSERALDAMELFLKTIRSPEVSTIALLRGPVTPGRARSCSASCCPAVTYLRRIRHPSPITLSTLKASSPMRTVARDLYLIFTVFAALAAILLVVCYGAPARRMCTFLVFDIGHNDLPFVSTVHNESHLFLVHKSRQLDLLLSRFALVKVGIGRDFQRVTMYGHLTRGGRTMVCGAASYS